MTHLRIEKGVPIPAATVRAGGNIQLLKDMVPGDSVYFEPEIMKKATRFYRVAKKLGMRIVIRRDGAGMRMWRIAEGNGNGVGEATAAELSKIVVAQAARKTVIKKKPAPKKKLNGKEAKRERDRQYRARKKAEKAKAVVVPDLGRNIP